MGLFTGLLGLPLAPLKGTLWIAGKVMEQAEQELADPARIRRQLEEIDRLRAEGSLTDEEAEVMEDELVQRLITSQPRTGQWEV